MGDLLAELVTRNIGAMVVVDADGLVGIVSERDVVRRLHEIGAELLGRPVSDIMTTQVVTCTPDDTLDSLSALMTTNRVRHVPVIVAGSSPESSASATWSRPGWRSSSASRSSWRPTSRRADRRSGSGYTR